MKVKYFLRGLGTGIIIATIVLAIAFGVEKSRNSLIEKTTKETTDLFNEQTSDDANNKGEEETEESEEIIEVTTPATPEIPEIETQAIDLNNDANNPENGTNNQNPAGTAMITINPGMSSETVSEILRQNGIINDANDFNNYLTSNGYATAIRTGSYDLPVNADYAYIASVISRR